jgi:hypothetical protein
MLGVREQALVPGQDFAVTWEKSSFKVSGLREEFKILNPSARAVAFTSDGTPVAYEHRYRLGDTIVFGGFVGQTNYTTPTEKHPLGQVLIQWAKINTPSLESSGPIELREMTSGLGRVEFFFNHEKTPVKLKFTLPLEHEPRQIAEVFTGGLFSSHGGGDVSSENKVFRLEMEVPPETVRIYRIDYRLPSAVQ